MKFIKLNIQQFASNPSTNYTETKLNELSINYLSEAKYNTLKKLGYLEDNELYMTPDNDGKANIFDLIYPVGSYYETSDTSFDPNVTWGGTWELEVDGTVLVSKSTTSGSKFNVDVGTIIGEETHTLTVNEMPAHYHIPEGGNSFATKVGSEAEGYGTGLSSGYLLASKAKTSSQGGSQPHNNVQPSKVVNRWHRTA